MDNKEGEIRAVTATALALLPVRTMDDVQMIGHAMASSGMFGLKNDSQGTVLAMTCVMEGITPMAFRRKYHVLDNGDISMRADAMAAGFRALGGRYVIKEHSVRRAAALFEFEGKKLDAEFTIEDAARHGYTTAKSGKDKTNWERHTEDMLWARLMSQNVRMLAPEVCAGAYPLEEMADFRGDEHEKIAERAEIPVNPEDAAKMVPIDKTPPAKKPSRPKKTPAPEATPFDAAPETDAPPGPDFTLCPMAPFEGQAWTELDTGVLKHALNKVHSGMQEGHRRAIDLVMDARGGAA